MRLAPPGNASPWSFGGWCSITSPSILPPGSQKPCAFELFGGAAAQAVTSVAPALSAIGVAAFGNISTDIATAVASRSSRAMDAVATTLQGEYAIAVWDESAERLTLARDLVGSMPLYYIDSGTTFIFSSDVKWLVAYSGKGLNREHLLGCVIASEDVDSTAFADIHRVPPATIVSWGRQGLERHTYWEAPSQLSRAHQLSDLECQQQIRTLLHNAVKRRIARSNVAVELSGGWDSSCLAAMTAAELQPRAEPPIVFSYIYNESPTSDESYFADAVAQHLGARQVRILESEAASLSNYQGAAAVATLPTPFICQFPLLRSIRQHCAALSIDCLMSGQGGDHLFLSQDMQFPVLSGASGRPLLARVREAARWSQHLHQSIAELVRESIVGIPAFTPTAQSGIKDRLSWFPEWFANDTAEHYDTLRTRTHELAKQVGHSRARRVHLVDGLVRLVSACYHDDVFDTCRISYPYLDKDVLEFLLATPVHQLTRPGEWRSLQGRAFGQLLPGVMCKRAGKRGPGESLLRAVRREWATLEQWFKGSRAAELGLIDDGRFMLALRQIKHGKNQWLGYVTWTIALEAWLRTQGDDRAPLLV